MNGHVHPLFAEILDGAAAIAPPQPRPPVNPTYVRACQACWNSDNGSSGCVQCAGRGRVATNGGEV